MASFARTAEQRARFDAIVFETVRDVGGTTTELRDLVRDRLIATKEPWAKALARETRFPISMRSVLERLRNAKRVRCEPQGPQSKWYVVTP